MEECADIKRRHGLKIIYECNEDEKIIDYVLFQGKMFLLTTLGVFVYDDESEKFKSVKDK